MVVPSRMILSPLIRAIPGRCLFVKLGGWFQFSMNSFAHLLEGRRESRNGTAYNALPRVSSLRGEVTASSITPTIFIGPLGSCGFGRVTPRAWRLTSLIVCDRWRAEGRSLRHAPVELVYELAILGLRILLSTKFHTEIFPTATTGRSLPSYPHVAPV